MSLLKYVTIVNQNGESSKSTKRKTTDHQQEKITEYEKNRTRICLPNGTKLVRNGHWMVSYNSVKIKFLKALAKPGE
jgi:hypothetical protein